MATLDRRAMGPANSFLEAGGDLGRVRRERLAKVQRAMAARGIGALLLTDIVNIRYCTGVSVMPLWTAVNLAHYVVVPVEGEPPNIPFPGDPHTDMPEGEFEENMVLAVECYAGKPGAQDGVKLEDEVWVTGDGATVLSLYPYDAKLLG